MLRLTTLFPAWQNERYNEIFDDAGKQLAACGLNPVEQQPRQYKTRPTKYISTFECVYMRRCAFYYTYEYVCVCVNLFKMAYKHLQECVNLVVHICTTMVS